MKVRKIVGPLFAFPMVKNDWAPTGHVRGPKVSKDQDLQPEVL